MRAIHHWIDGKEAPGTSGRTADVFNPATGEVQAKVDLATKAEMDAAIERAAEAQVKWGATNPQRRARVMMEMVRLLNRDMDKMAEMLSSEHGKTFPDAKGDIQRGLEVIEFSIGAPHLLKGEFIDGAGPGIDMYSMRQPLGVVAAITPFNFPAMIPLWKMGPALASGNAVILKPSERDPTVPNMLAALFKEAGLPDGVLQVVHGDKEAVDALLDSEVIQAVGFVGSTPIAQYIYERAAQTGKRAQCFGGAKNHMIIMPDADMDQAADALVGAGYGAAGERCMAISVAVPVGEETADRLIEKLIPRIEKLKVGPWTAGNDIDYGPVVTAAAKEVGMSRESAHRLRRSPHGAAFARAWDDARHHAGGLIEDIAFDALLADKAFDADGLLAELDARGASAVIPQKANRKIKRDYDKHAYKWRHMVENFFARIKEFRAIATRYEKTACSYAANWHFAATIIASR